MQIRQIDITEANRKDYVGNYVNVSARWLVSAKRNGVNTLYQCAATTVIGLLINECVSNISVNQRIMNVSSLLECVVNILYWSTVNVKVVYEYIINTGMRISSTKISQMNEYVSTCECET